MKPINDYKHVYLNKYFKIKRTVEIVQAICAPEPRRKSNPFAGRHHRLLRLQSQSEPVAQGQLEFLAAPALAWSALFVQCRQVGYINMDSFIKGLIFSFEVLSWRRGFCLRIINGHSILLSVTKKHILLKVMLGDN